MQISFKLSPRFGMPGQENPASAIHFEALPVVPTRTPLLLVMSLSRSYSWPPVEGPISPINLTNEDSHI